jgi:hypothetical protein
MGWGAVFDGRKEETNWKEGKRTEIGGTKEEEEEREWEEGERRKAGYRVN